MRRAAKVQISEECFLETGLRLLPHGTEIIAARYDRRIRTMELVVEHPSLPEVADDEPLGYAQVIVTQTSRYEIEKKGDENARTL